MPEPFDPIYSKTNFTLNTNANAKLISDTVAAIQVTQPDGVSTGQYKGAMVQYYWILKPVSVVSGWNISPLTYVYVNNRNNSNPAIIDSKSYDPLNINNFYPTTFPLFSGAQLIQPLGSTATSPMNVVVEEFASVAYKTQTKQITLTPESFNWNANVSKLDNITTSSAKIDLTTFLSVTGETFAGPGVSGTTFSPSSLTSGTYTITATKVYDNGTFQISKTFTIQ